MNSKPNVLESIKAYIEKKGEVRFGFCTAAPFCDVKDVYDRRIEEKLACEFEYRLDVDVMIDPKKLLDSAESILVVALPYTPYEYRENRDCGKMASGTAQEDYHIRIKRLLEPLQKQLNESYGILSEIVVDTSPLSDRSMAVRAGLGVIRRNGMCYNNQYGSYFYIGALLLGENLGIRDKSPSKDPCGQCRRCVEFCPSQAILGNYEINSNRCISYLTQKKKLSDEESVLLGNAIYGCDVCQRVCPANRGISYKKTADDLMVDVQVDYAAMMNISNKEFRETYGKSSAGWRGKKTLQRNAIAAMGNSSNKDWIKVLESCLGDQREVISSEAKRAIAKLEKE